MLKKSGHLLNLTFLFAAFFGLSPILKAQNPVSLTAEVSPKTIKAGEKATVKITAKIEEPWHLYSTTQPDGGPIATKISFENPSFVKSGEISGTKPKVALDQNFGINTETFDKEAVFNVPFEVTKTAVSGDQELITNVRFQVCNETTCLPPKTDKVSTMITVTGGLSAPIANTAVSANTTTTTSVEAPKTEQIVSENQNLEGVSWWSFIWLAMSFGALSLLTPCVFPMIPITVSYFTKNAAETYLGSLRDAAIYAFGIIFTFTGLGILLAVVFGATGLNRFAASPYINILITIIFVSFAFSLLGAYNLGIPSSVLTKLDGLTRKKGSSKIITLLLMGLTFSLTSFTCTAPLVGTVLVSASQGKLIFPIVGMLAFSSVFALPFFVLAVAPRLMSSLPKAGEWMNSVKVVMGLLELAAAAKFLSNVDLVWGWGIFTREAVLAIWIACCLMIVLYLLGKFRLSHDGPISTIGTGRVGFSIVFLAVSFYMLAGLFGMKLGELEAFLPPPTQSSLSMKQSGGEGNKTGDAAWITNDYKAALEKAKKENKFVFVDFTGYTCTNCRWMEANMFPVPEIDAEMGKFVLARLYTDREGEPYETFQKMQETKFGTVALPLYALVDGNDEIKATFAGLTRDKNEFLNFLKKGQK
jgi:thiol:disulfide interchange protein